MNDPIARLNTALEGRYRIERELGCGGMAVVYLADDERHGRPVAIKVLRAELGEAMGAERFAREIEIAAGLNHPNILSLHDSGEADGLLYFVMPYVEGESLRARLDREGTLSLDAATRIVSEVSGALSYAHRQGLVHRDVKPENILFQAGHALVCDFGIAKAVTEANDRLTRTGVTVGTFTYMSPEQLSEGASVDGRSDVYSLGCILHEMLEGEAPFTAGTPQAAMAKKLMGTLPPPSSRTDVPPTVRGVVHRSLATTPEGRFQTADDLSAALTHATTEVAILHDSRRRRTATVARVVSVVAFLVAVSAGGWWILTSTPPPAYQRVAVLPLANRASDSEQEYFVQGVHEDLVLELQRAGVRVINPASVRRYASTDAPVAEIADELGVDGLIQGSARLTGRRIEIELLLVDPYTEELVWTESFEGEVRDVRGLLGGVTRSVASAIGLRLDPEVEARLAAAPEVDEVVYEALLQARFEGFKLTEAGLDRAQGFYELALGRDSSAVEAWVGLAGLWNLRAQQGLVSGDEAAERSAPFYARARAIDPERGGRDFANDATRLTWPEWRLGQWTEAERAFIAALEQDPSDAVTRAYFALLLLYLGRDEEGERQTDWAAEQAPDDALVQGLHGQALNALHRWDEAEEAMTRARRFEPDAPMLLSTLRTTYHLQGRHELAIAMWRDSYRTTGDLEALAALNRGYAEAGYERALTAVAELFVERSASQRVTPWQIGTLYTRAGVPDEAIRYLEAAVEEGDPNSPYLSIDAIFDPLREDPRFDALVDRLGLPT